MEFSIIVILSACLFFVVSAMIGVPFVKLLGYFGFRLEQIYSSEVFFAFTALNGCGFLLLGYELYCISTQGSSTITILFDYDWAQMDFNYVFYPTVKAVIILTHLLTLSLFLSFCSKNRYARAFFGIVATLILFMTFYLFVLPIISLSQPVIFLLGSFLSMLFVGYFFLKKINNEYFE